MTVLLSGLGWHCHQRHYEAMQQTVTFCCCCCRCWCRLLLLVLLSAAAMCVSPGVGHGTAPRGRLQYCSNLTLKINAKMKGVNVRLAGNPDQVSLNCVSNNDNHDLDGRQPVARCVLGLLQLQLLLVCGESVGQDNAGSSSCSVLLSLPPLLMIVEEMLTSSCVSRNVVSDICNTHVCTICLYESV